MSQDSTNSNANGSPSENMGADLKQPLAQLEELKGQVEKFKNDYLYLRAEFDTYRRNVIKERADLTKYGNERLIVELLGVLDNFERALETRLSAENFATYAKGVEMTAVEFRSVLQKFGVQEIPSLGQPFDPSVHEALTSEASAATPDGSILRVLRKPYKLHDRIVRPGQVVVARAPQN